MANEPTSPNKLEQGINTVSQAAAGNAILFSSTHVPGTLATTVPEGRLPLPGAKHYLDELKAKLKVGDDPVAGMLVEQIALTHHRIAHMHWLCRMAEEPETPNKEAQLRKQARAMERMTSDLAQAVRDGASDGDLHKKIGYVHTDSDSDADDEAMQAMSRVAVGVDRAHTIATYNAEAVRLSRELRQLVAELRRHQAQTRRETETPPQRQAKDVVYRIDPAESA